MLALNEPFALGLRWLAIPLTILRMSPIPGETRRSLLRQGVRGSFRLVLACLKRAERSSDEGRHPLPKRRLTAPRTLGGRFDANA